MNALLGQAPSLRADVVGVSLGPPMFQVTGAIPPAVEVPLPPPETTVVPAGTVVTVHAAPVTVTIPSAVFEALVAEVRGLRADLASRTLTARARRVWRWLRERLGF